MSKMKKAKTDLEQVLKLDPNYEAARKALRELV